MTSHKSSDVRRREIVDAMIDVMAEHGYAKATISRIAEAADLTPGLLHYHFSSKGAILQAVLERLVDEQIELLRGLSNEEESAPARLDAVLRALLSPGESAAPERVATWVAITAEAVRQPDVGAQMAAALESFRDLFVDIVREGIAHGSFVSDGVEPDAAAAGLLALVQGYYNLGVTARAVVPKGSALPVARRMIRGLLAPNEE